MCFVAPPARSRFHKTLDQGQAPTPRETAIDETKGKKHTMSKSENRNRTALLPSIRCFPEEKEVVRIKAEAAGLSIGAFMLRSALGRRIDTKCDTELIMELRRLGGLQKHLFKEGGGMLSKEYSEVLVAIQKAILKVGLE